MCRCMSSIVLYSIAVKHVQVNVVHCLVQYSCLTVLYCTRQWTPFTCTCVTAILYRTMDNIHLHMFDCTVKRVQVNVVDWLVQYSTVKHVEVNGVHFLVQYSTVKYVQVHVVHCLV
jgi:hypothetical protein